MLSEEQINECERIAAIAHQEHKRSSLGQPSSPADYYQWHFARALEAEVRKDYDALIRQMLEALETCHDSGPYSGPDQYYFEAVPVKNAIAAANRHLDQPE